MERKEIIFGGVSNVPDDSMSGWLMPMKAEKPT